jgi:hypothetical protein
MTQLHFRIRFRLVNRSGSVSRTAEMVERLTLWGSDRFASALTKLAFIQFFRRISADVHRLKPFEFCNLHLKSPVSEHLSEIFCI